MLDTERQQVAVLRKLREELLKGSTVKGADGASTWTIEELTEYVLARSAQTARYAGRASSTGASNIPGIAVNPNDAFHTFFVKRNEIPLFEGSLVDLDILSIPLTPSGGGAGRSHTSPKKSGSLSSPTPVINFIIVTTTKGFLYVYEAEQMNLLTTIETQHLSRIAETRCAYFHFDAFCVTAGVDGGVKLHSLTVYNHGHFVAGHRLQLLPKETPSPSPSIWLCGAQRCQQPNPRLVHFPCIRQFRFADRRVCAQLGLQILLDPHRSLSIDPLRMHFMRGCAIIQSEK